MGDLAFEGPLASVSGLESRVFELGYAHMKMLESGILPGWVAVFSTFNSRMLTHVYICVDFRLA